MNLEVAIQGRRGGFTDIQSVAAAIQNLQLVAFQEGVRTCWMTDPVHFEDDINEITGATDKKLQALIALGYSAGGSPTPKRTGGRVEWIGWD